MSKLLKFFVVIVVVVTISACATPTISDHIQLVNIALPPGDPNTDTHATRISGGGLDYGRDVTCDADDSCTLFGYTLKSFGESTDFLAVHLDASGAVTWARTYGGTNRDELWRVIKTQDQGHLLMGWSESLFFTPLKFYSPHRSRRPFILKLDEDGRMQWAKTLEIWYADTNLLGATQDVDGNYILVGKLDLNLSLPNQRSAEDEQWRWKGENPIPTHLSGYRRDILVLKLSADGRPMFMNRYIPNNNLSVGSSVLAMPNGHVLIAGREEVFDTKKKNPLLLEIDSKGQPVRSESFNSGMDEYPQFILRQPSGGVVLAGATSRNGELSKVFSLWLDRAGAMQNARLYSNPKGLQVMNAILGHDNRLSVAAHTTDYNTGTAAGVAFIVSDNGVIDNSFVLSGQGNVELDGIWPLAEGRYRLLGDTAGFGASYRNIVTAVWMPNSKAEFTIGESSYAPSVELCTIDYMSGDLNNVRDIPVSLVEMNNIKVGEKR